MTSTPSIDRRTRDTRDRIRVAAIELFFVHGFPATSVRELTSACSVTPAALYNHYASKEDILVDIFATTMAEIDETVQGVMEQADTPSGRLAMMALGVTHYHAAHRERGGIILKQANWLPETQLAERNEWFRGYRRRLEQLLAEGVAAGDMRLPLLHEFEGALSVSAKGLFDLWTQVGGWFRPDGPYAALEVARVYSRLSMQSVGSQPQDALIDSVAQRYLT